MQENSFEEERPEEESVPSPLPIVLLKDDHSGSAWWAGEPQAIQEPEAEKIEESLFCHEVLFPFTSIGGSSLQVDYRVVADGNNEQLKRDVNYSEDGFPSLDDIAIDTLSDFHLSDLQFGSQDSIMSWLDRI